MFAVRLTKRVNTRPFIAANRGSFAQLRYGIVGRENIVAWEWETDKLTP